MSLKAYVEGNPLTILLAVAITTATTTAGVVTSLLDSRHAVDKAKVEAEYKADAVALKTRLASIERKLGTDESRYFDVSQLVITPERVKSLDGSFKSAGGGQFFYSLPTGQRWQYRVTSEYELLKLKVEFGKDNPLARLAGALGEKNVHLWTQDPSFRIRPTPRKGFEEIAPKEIRFFPLVSIQIVDERQFTQAVGQFRELLAGGTLAASSPGGSTTTGQVARRLDELSARLAQLDAGGSGASARPAAAQPAADVGLLADSRIEAEAQLQQLFRGDIAAALLVGFIQQGFGLSQFYENTRVDLSSVQKKGNVLYMRAPIRFGQALVSGQDKPVPFTVDREIFIVTSPKNAYLVNVEVPTVDGRSDAYAWVGQWLSGIRIPL